MSVEILLIPMAMAAVAAWSARGETATAHTCLVGTRMRDRELLKQALESLGAEVREDDKASLRAAFSDTTLQFAWNEDGIATAHVDDDDLARAEEVIRMIDTEYAALVQARVYERLQQRVERLGIRVESEQVGDDNSITLVLAMEQQA